MYDQHIIYSNRFVLIKVFNYSHIFYTWEWLTNYIDHYRIWGLGGGIVVWNCKLPNSALWSQWFKIGDEVKKMERMDYRVISSHIDYMNTWNAIWLKLKLAWLINIIPWLKLIITWQKFVLARLIIIADHG
jgi:hypothetical protein